MVALALFIKPNATFDNGIAMTIPTAVTALGYDLAAVKQAFQCSSVLETTTQQNFDRISDIPKEGA